MRGKRNAGGKQLTNARITGEGLFNHLATAPAARAWEQLTSRQKANYSQHAEHTIAKQIAVAMRNEITLLPPGTTIHEYNENVHQQLATHSNAKLVPAKGKNQAHVRRRRTKKELIVLANERKLEFLNSALAKNRKLARLLHAQLNYVDPNDPHANKKKQAIQARLDGLHKRMSILHGISVQWEPSKRMPSPTTQMIVRPAESPRPTRFIISPPEPRERLVLHEGTGETPGMEGRAQAMEKMREDRDRYLREKSRFPKWMQRIAKVWRSFRANRKKN